MAAYLIILNKYKAFASRIQKFTSAGNFVAVWGGPARFTYHGVAPLEDGKHPLTGRYRFNLTLRKAL